MEKVLNPPRKAEIHEWCGRLNDPERGVYCPCVKWQTTYCPCEKCRPGNPSKPVKKCKNK